MQEYENKHANGNLKICNLMKNESQNNIALKWEANKVLKVNDRLLAAACGLCHSQLTVQLQQIWCGEKTVSS